MNLFLPSVKLKSKKRIGARRIRCYDDPQTPFQRVLDSGLSDPTKIAVLQQIKSSLNPFHLGDQINQKIEKILSLANRRHSPKAKS
jgi:hypothetical protein